MGGIEKRKLLIGAVIAGVALGLFLSLKREALLTAVPALEEILEKQSHPEEIPSRQTEAESLRQGLSHALQASAPETPPLKLRYFRAYRESEEAKEEFSKAASVEAHFPEEYRFRPIDMDLEDLTGIYAPHDKMDIAVIAGRMVPADGDVLEYLKSDQTGIPNVDAEDFTLSPKAVEVDPISGSGMGTGKYWTGRSKSGKEFRVGLMPRADGLGSYLVILSGDANWVNDSDEFFEDLYRSFKALPPP